MDEQINYLLEELKVAGLRTFGGSYEAFTEWLFDDIPELGNVQPVTLLNNKEGIRTVLQRLTMMHYGSY